MNYTDLFNRTPYSVLQADKEALLLNYMKILTKHHMNSCDKYNRLLNVLGFNPDDIKSLEDVPFIPVTLFKNETLCSVTEDEVFKVMTSSGTTGQKVSKIFLDADTAYCQQKVLSSIMSEFIGSKRIPMLIIDCPNVLKDRKSFSARGAAILGFSMFASCKCYALDNSMNIDMDSISEFLEKYKDQKILIFGFTYIIWKFFYESLKNSGIHLDLHNAVLLHGGGWKKMISSSVTNDEFKRGLNEISGLTKIHNYYGMIEQTGSIYVECEYNHLHASTYSDIIIRNMKDFSICSNGEKGVIQLLSPLAKSYPGHSILTEDEGFIIGVDDCPCGRSGKYFTVTGRIPNAEIRGCSDTYEL